MKGRAKSAPGFDSTGYDVATLGGWITFVFVTFAKGSSDTRVLVRVLGVGGNRVAYGGVENVFCGEVGVSGVNIENSIFVFALLKEMHVFRRVDTFLYEFRYDSFDSGVKTSFLTERGK